MKLTLLTTAAVLRIATAHGDCDLITPSLPIVQDLSGLAGVSFKGTKPSITRLEGDPLLRILKHTSEPILEVKGGKLIVSSSTCGADADGTTTASAAARLMPNLAVAILTFLLGGSEWTALAVGAISVMADALPTTYADGTCEDIMEVEIHGPVKSVGQAYMEDMIRWPYYDGREESLHFTADPVWAEDVEASRAFRKTSSGSVYNYRNKVLMGLAQTRVLNGPPSATPKDAVTFDLPNVVLPDTDEGIMMLSVLEMQALLRAGDLTSVQITSIALSMLEKYDPEYNMLEVELRDLALRIAGEADKLFSAGQYVSFIQGIPFAIKDTYDVAGYATAYGSWEFLDNIVETESPLVTYAVENYAVPLFKSTVPQLTWGTANYKGTVYSCLNGGYSAGTGTSGGSSIGSGTAVCLGVVPVAICEQTGSSCQSPAIANGISTVIPALGTFTRENNGLYSLETDRPGLLCRDILSCAVFYNYMRGTSPGDPQSRDVPFSDPSKEDISTYTIGFVDNSDTEGWPLGWDTPFKGQRGNVLTALEDLGATVTIAESPEDFMEPTQLFLDYDEAGPGGGTLWWDWYFLNVEGFFENVFLYGGEQERAIAYGPVWVGQNFNFDFGYHRNHIGATAYAYLENLWLFGYTAEKAMYPMLQTLPDVVVHFAQSELNGAYNGNMIKRAGINTVHIPEFYWNTTDESFVDWRGTRPIDYYDKTTISAAMITCESKKYEPVKAFAVCYQFQQALVPGGKLISPYKDIIHEALKNGDHDLDCPYDWSDVRPKFVDDYPKDIKSAVMQKMSNIGRTPTCKAPS